MASTVELIICNRKLKSYSNKAHITLVQETPPTTYTVDLMYDVTIATV